MKYHSSAPTLKRFSLCIRWSLVLKSLNRRWNLMNKVVSHLDVALIAHHGRRTINVVEEGGSAPEASAMLRHVKPITFHPSKLGEPLRTMCCLKFRVLQPGRVNSELEPAWMTWKSSEVWFSDVICFVEQATFVCQRLHRQ